MAAAGRGNGREDDQISIVGKQRTEQWREPVEGVCSGVLTSVVRDTTWRSE